MIGEGKLKKKFAENTLKAIGITKQKQAECYEIASYIIVCCFSP